MTPNIDGKSLVTGASSGIGMAYARRLADRGHELVLVARRKGELDRLAEEIAASDGKPAEVIAADLSDSNDVSMLEKRIAQGDIGMVVNNAGMGGMSRFVETETGDLERMIAINVTALTRLTQSAAKALQAKGQGIIVNVASGASFAVIPGAAVYSGTKGFVAQFTRALAQELADSGITLQLLVPGLTRTNLGGAEDMGLFDNFPEGMAQSAEDVVTGSLAGLELGELVCLPRQEDYSLWETASDAMNKVGTDPEHSRLPSRYTRQS